jgi:hypothetical protein
VGLKGKVQAGEQGVGQTRRTLDALISTAVGASAAHQGALQRLLSELPDLTDHLVITKHYDATPLMLRFGRLQHLLCPHARYTVQDASRKWKLIRFDEFRQLHPQASPAKGVLEFFIQEISLHWEGPNGRGPQTATHS